MVPTQRTHVTYALFSFASETEAPVDILTVRWLAAVAPEVDDHVLPTIQFCPPSAPELNNCVMSNSVASFHPFAPLIFELVQNAFASLQVSANVAGIQVSWSGAT